MTGVQTCALPIFTLLFNKGKRPIIQDFKGRIKNITLLKKELGMISKDLKIKFYQLRDLK